MKNMYRWFLGFWLTVLPAALLAEGFVELEQGKVAEALPEGEVVEFFWYNCPHCYRMEALLRSAGLKSQVVKVPAVVRGSWLFAAKLHYTLEKMALQESLNDRVFDYIHVQKKPLTSKDDLPAFLAQHALNEQDFMSVFNSPEIYDQAMQAVNLTRQYAPNGVPAFVVKRRFRTGPDLAGSLEATVEQLKNLLQKE